MHFPHFSDKNKRCICKNGHNFFAKFPAEQTPQLFLLNDHTNRKNTNKKYNRPCQVLPFLMAFSGSGSLTNGDTSFLWEPRVTFWLFFRPTSGGQTPEPILKQNGSNDVHSRKDVPFAVKISTFHTPWSPGPPKRSKFCKFLDLEIFRSISP